LISGISGGYVGVDFIAGSINAPFQLNKTATKIGFWSNAGTYATQFVLHVGYVGTLIKDDGTRIARNDQTIEFVVTVPKGEAFNVIDLADIYGTNVRDVEATAITWLYIGGTHGRGKVTPHTSGNGGLCIDDIMFF
jgi:hypothetical protein